MQVLAEQIMERARALPEGTPIAAKSLLHLGSRAAVDQALSRLVRRGRLLRAGRGLYVRPIESRFGVRTPAVEKVARAVGEQRGEVERLRTAAAAAERVAPAITAYHGRLAAAIAPWQTYHYFLGRKPGDWAFAWREVVGRYGRMSQGETLDAARDRMRTLTALADRLAPLDSGPTPLPTPQASPSAEAIRAFSADVLPRINWG